MACVFLVLFSFIIVILGGGSNLYVQSCIILSLGLILIYNTPRSVAYKYIDYATITVCALGLIQFLPIGSSLRPNWWCILSNAGIQLPIFVSSGPLISLEAYLIFISAVTWLYICLQGPMGHAERAKCLWLFSFGGAFLSIIIILANFYGFVSPFAKDSSVFSFFPNRNQTSNVICICTFISFCLFIECFHRKKNRFSIIAFINAFVGFFGIILLLSRASIIFLFVGIALWLLLHYASYLKGFIIKYLLPTFGLFILFFLIFKQDNFLRLVHIFNFNKSNLDFRLLIFQDTLKLIQQDQFLGVGMGNFSYIFRQVRDSSIMYGSILHPENDWLLSLAQCGIFFTLTLAFFVFYTLYKTFKEQNKKVFSYRSIASTACIIFLLHSLCDIPSHRLGTVFIAIHLFSLSITKTKEVPSIIPPYAFKGIAYIFCIYSLITFSALALKKPWTPQTAISSYKAQVLGLLQSNSPDKEEAISKIIAAGKFLTPLDSWWYFQNAQYLLRFSKTPLSSSSILDIKNEFEKAKLLDPINVHIPLNEGLLWLPIHTELAFKAFQTALMIDNFSPQASWRFVLNQCNDNPTYKPYLSNLSKLNKDFRLLYLYNLKPNELSKEIKYDLHQDSTLSFINKDQKETILLKWSSSQDVHGALDYISSHPKVIEHSWKIYANAYQNLKLYKQSCQIIFENLPTPSWPLLKDAAIYKPQEIEFRFQVSPNDIVAGLSLLKIYIEEKNYKKALKIIEKLESNKYKSPLSDYWKAFIYYTESHYERSNTILKNSSLLH